MPPAITSVLAAVPVFSTERVKVRRCPPLLQLCPVQPGPQVQRPLEGWHRPLPSQMHRSWHPRPKRPAGHTACRYRGKGTKHSTVTQRTQIGHKGRNAENGHSKVQPLKFNFFISARSTGKYPLPQRSSRLVVCHVSWYSVVSHVFGYRFIGREHTTCPAGR